MNQDWRRTLRLWAPSLIAIPLMLVLGLWIKEVGFLLFAHHMFWIIGIILLINPVSETFWPSPKSRRRQPPQASAKTRQRADKRKQAAKRKAGPNHESPAERLARLLKQKQAVDRQIEKISVKDKEQAK